MSDFLYDSAKAYDKLLDYNYTVLLGSAKRTETNITVHIVPENFTHVVGLDHLSDIRGFKTNKSNLKEDIYYRILKRKLTEQDIKSSDYFTEPFSKTYNSQTKSEYTVTERIMALQNIEKHLDNAFSGKFGGEVYKWNVGKSKIMLPDGRIKNSSISADYLIAVQSGNNPDEKIYFFTYLYNNGKVNDNSKHLYIFSAFPDCLDLTQGQKKVFTILQAEKINVKENTSQLLYVHPAYQKQLSSQSQQQDNSNINQIKFDSPMTAHNIRISNGAAAIAADPPIPNPFNNILEKIKAGLSRIFTPKDKPAPPPAVQTEETPNVPEEIPAVTEEPVPETAANHETTPTEKALADLAEARESFAEGRISKDDYVQSVKSCLRTLDNLDNDETLTKAAETLRRELAGCSSEKKCGLIRYELANIDKIIAKKNPPKQTLKELEEYAHEQYLKAQRDKAKTADTQNRDEKSYLGR